MMLAAFMLQAVVAQAGGYHWPLDLPRQVTSSFGEYRTGRFHAGIDLRTSGTGRDVRAPRDGHVSRVRVSPWGYGKALYITLDDGNNVVFAHLESFSEPVMGYVRAAQHRNRDYTVDLWPELGQFPVKRGEIVAKSGDTGVGPPHLHYELRDGANRPINPRMVGDTWPDSTPPTFRKLLVAPAGPGSTVNGGKLPVPIEVRPDGAGGYTADPVAVWGRVGFGADVIDPANEGANRLGVYELRTQKDGQPVFFLRKDRLDYGNNAHGVVSFHPFYLSHGRFLLQWRWPDNRAEPYRHAPQDGWIPAPLTGADVVIEAEDFMGNVARLTVPLVPDDPAPPPERRGSTSPGIIEMRCAGVYLVLVAQFPDDEPAIPQLTVTTEDASDPAISFRRVDSRTFHAAYDPEPGVTAATFTVSHDRLPPYTERVAVFQRGNSGRTAFGDLMLNVPHDAPFGALYARVQATGLPAAAPIQAESGAWHIWPEASPIDEPVELSFPAPATADARTAVYRLAGSHWAPLDTQRRDGRLVTSTRRFGAFAIMTDNVPPEVRIAAPTEPVVSAYTPIRVAVSDRGTGIARIDAWCGDQWLLMAYNPDTNMAVWKQDQPLSQGRQTLRVVVRDGAGNETVRTREITVK